jgi:hypothetical protein
VHRDIRKKGRFFALAPHIIRMRFSPLLVIILLAGTAVFAVGCTQATSPVQPATPVLITVSPLQDLAFGPADLPACFSLTEQHARSSGDVGTLARDLGWKDGYMVTYSCPAEGSDPTVIIQSLAVYPAENMPGIASLVDRQDRSDPNYTYENLTFPDQGTTFRGFYGKVVGAMDHGIRPGTSLVSDGRDVPETNTVSGNDVAEIIICRGTVFEVLKMTGPETNVTLLKDLAGKVSAKIP